MNDLNFSCTKCGACCTEPPQLTMQEALELSDKFFLQLAHFSIVSYEKAPIHKDLIDHYTKFCHIFYLPESNCHLYYFVALKAVARPSQKCPQLVGNLCSIQHKKPIMCRIAPLNAMVSEEQQPNTFESQWQPLIREGVFKCDTSSNAPLIVKDGSIDNYLMEENFYQYLNQIRELTNFYVKNVLNVEDTMKQHIKYCYGTAAKTNSSVFYTSNLDVLKNYYNLSMIDDYSVQHFVDNQKTFIKQDIERSLSQKFLNDRDITKLMRAELKILNDYQLEDSDEIRFM